MGADVGGVNPDFININSDLVNDSWLTINFTDGGRGGQTVPHAHNINFDDWGSEGINSSDGFVYLQEPNNNNFREGENDNPVDIIIAQLNVQKDTPWSANINAKGYNINSDPSTDNTIWTIENILFSNDMTGIQGDTANAVESSFTNYDTNSPYNVCPDIDGDDVVSTEDMLSVLAHYSFTGISEVDWSLPITSGECSVRPAGTRCEASPSQKIASIAAPEDTVNIQDLVGLLTKLRKSCQAEPDR